MVKGIWSGLFLASLCAACSGAGLGKPIAQFPSKAALEEVAQEPAAPAARENVVTLDRWVLEVQAPAPGAAYPAESSWDKGVLAAVSKAGARLVASPELRCSAQETARFFTENGAFPDDGLRNYIIARCGSTLPATALSSVSFELPDTMTDPEVEAFVKSPFEKLIAQLDSAQGQVGVGFARGKGRGSLVLYWGTPVVVLDAFSPLVEGDQAVFSGQFSSDQGMALGLITRGRYGVLPCEPDRREAYPRFKLTCPIAKDDDRALVEVVTRRPERLLAEPVMRAMFRRSEAAGLTYESGAYAPAAAAAANGPKDFRAALLSAVNEARKAAEIAPFQLEASQSDLNEKVTPHFFDASYERDEEKCDLVALGVLAGWDVQGSIRGGGVYALSQSSTTDAVRWLNTALDSPLARSALLDGEMSRIAIGSSALPPNGVMALVTTYALFGSSDHSAEEHVVFEEIAKQRAARNLSAPRRRQRGKDMDIALRQVAQNELTSGDALQEALTRVGSASPVPIRGWIVETSDLALIPTDESLLAAGNLDLEIGITHYKAQGGAWAQYVVLLMFTLSEPPDSGQRASAGAVPQF
jgi:hypothetical protein